MELIKPIQHPHHIYETTIIYCRSLVKKLRNSVVRYILRQSNKIANVLTKQESKLLTSNSSSFIQPPSDAIKSNIGKDKI